jgi:hypothetical protein
LFINEAKGDEMPSKGLIDMPASSRLLPETTLWRGVMGISRSTLRRIQLDIKNGGDPDQLPPAIVIRKRRFYSQQDVDAWMASRRGH